MSFINEKQTHYVCLEETITMSHMFGASIMLSTYALDIQCLRL